MTEMSYSGREHNRTEPGAPHGCTRVLSKDKQHEQLMIEDRWSLNTAAASAVQSKAAHGRHGAGGRA